MAHFRPDSGRSTRPSLTQSADLSTPAWVRNQPNVEMVGLEIESLSFPTKHEKQESNLPSSLICKKAQSQHMAVCV